MTTYMMWFEWWFISDQPADVFGVLVDMSQLITIGQNLRILDIIVPQEDI